MNVSQNEKQTLELISSLEYVYQLKIIPRSGWVQSGIPRSEVESIASHSYGMSILILYLRSELLSNGINVERALSMALIHDIAEAIVGDITPKDSIADMDKHAAEADAFLQIISGIQEGDSFYALWQEFEMGQSPEAQLVKRMDKLDMLIQAYIYEKHYKMRLDSFWEGMDDLFMNSESESLYNHLQLNRYEIEGNQE